MQVLFRTIVTGLYHHLFHHISALSMVKPFSEVKIFSPQALFSLKQSICCQVTIDLSSIFISMHLNILLRCPLIYSLMETLFQIITYHLTSNKVDIHSQIFHQTAPSLLVMFPSEVLQVMDMSRFFHVQKLFICLKLFRNIIPAISRYNFRRLGSSPIFIGESKISHITYGLKIIKQIVLIIV